MRKFWTVFLAAMLVFFTLPFGGIKSLAKENHTVIPEQAFEIDYTIKHENRQQNSVADSFFEKPAILLEKDDKKYVQLKITSGDMIQNLRNAYGDALLVKENDDDSIVVQLRINDDLSDMQADMHVIVPQGAIPGFPGYDQEHTTFLVFDQESIQEVNVSDYYLVISENENGPDPEPSDPVDPDLPGEDEPEADPENGSDDDHSEDESNQDGDDPDVPEDTEEPEDETDEAERDSAIGLDNGSYQLDVSYLKIDNDDASTMARYLGDTVFITVEDGTAYVTLTVNDHATVTKLLVDGNKSVEAKLDGDTRYETFRVDRLDEIEAYVAYVVPGVWQGDADFRMIFAAEEDAVEVDPSEQPGYDIPTVLLNLDDGFYSTSVAFLRSDNDNSSAMGRYLEDTVFFAVEDGTMKVTLTINNNETVTKLQVNGEDAIEKVIDGDKRYETFELKDLESIADAYVEYQAPYDDSIHYGQADFRIAFDLEEIAEADEADKPGVEDKETSEEPKDPLPPQPKPSNPVEDPNKDDEANEQLIPDKAYTIDYVILHENGLEESLANQFFVKPGLLLEKDGRKYVQFTITNSDMIQALSNAYGDYLLVQTNEDGSIVVQLRVNDDLSDMLLDMHVVVPPMPGFPGYDEQHVAILSFETESMEEIDSSNYLLIATGDPNNGNGPYVEGETPDKPDFDDDEDQNKENGDSTPNGDGNGTNNENPKTGDTTNVILYSLLLISSAIPLAIKLRRRFV